MRRPILAAIVIAFIASQVAAAPPPTPIVPQVQNAHWIWLKGSEEAANTSVYFAKTLKLTAGPKEAVVQISCDNEYKLWINGAAVGQTPNPTAEAWRVVETYDVAKVLKEGDNYVAVQGTNQAGKAALLVALVVRYPDGKEDAFYSDQSWEAATDPGDTWQQARPASGNWQPALDYGASATTPPWFYPRPPSSVAAVIPKTQVALRSRVVEPASVKLDPSTTAALTGFKPESGNVQGTLIKATAPGQKAVFICDFGKESVGYPILLGNAYGLVTITAACGEYEKECNAPYQPVHAKQTSRGAIRWTSPDRRAFRYVKFTIEPTSEVRLERIQAELVEYPVAYAGAFECSDAALNKVWDVSRHTVHLCMQDFFEDGIKRDRLLWIGDLRVEALAGYYLFGDSSLARRSLMQLANIQLPDGMIPGVGPNESSTYLPDYCAYFVMSVADHYRHSGDIATAKLLYPYVQKVMDWFKANSDDTGLFRHADRAGWWIFIDWDESLEKKDRVMPLEALYHWALRDAADLAKAAGNKADVKTYTDRALQLAASVNSKLWSEAQGAYTDCLTDEGPSQRIHRQPNALAVLAGLPTAEMMPKVVGALADPAKMPPVTTPYMNFYVASALFEQGRAVDGLNLIRSYWGAMVERGATSCWEKFDPNWPVPYEQADLSYCHGWSAGPGAMLPAYVAGVRPAMPGFQRVLVAPDLGGLEWVKATVPTSFGQVKVDWKADHGCPIGTIDVPRGTTADIVLPAPPEGWFYAVGGKRAGKARPGEKVTLSLGGDKSYTFTLIEDTSRKPPAPEKKEEPKAPDTAPAALVSPAG